ncbi:MAG: hypothetical protein AUK50_05425 [Comamonadaceae bacterium CG2_30_57_122]|nr:MAG: hypothetical protein AUK50_05425 [Comamonadaceae bacterium CG2_30_57_122]
MPKLFQGKSAGAAVHVWRTGCSTGEEAYSIAILLQEQLESLKASYKVQVFATDIDSCAIAVARTGVYPASIAENISPEPAHSVQADPTRLKQVLINLLSNAIKYNRSGGTVTLACSAPTPERLRISVQDTGEGLSEAKLAQLFQPFNRLGQEASATKGTGIGLVVSQRLV